MSARLPWSCYPLAIVHSTCCPSSHLAHGRRAYPTGGLPCSSPFATTPLCRHPLAHLFPSSPLFCCPASCGHPSPRASRQAALPPIPGPPPFSPWGPSAVGGSTPPTAELGCRCRCRCPRAPNTPPLFTSSVAHPSRSTPRPASSAVSLACGGASPVGRTALPDGTALHPASAAVATTSAAIHPASGGPLSTSGSTYLASGALYPA